MAKKLKYTVEQTEKAWQIVQECLNDDAEYNENTQPIISAKQALKVAMDALSSLNLKIEWEDIVKFYYDCYRGFVLSELHTLNKFDISFWKKGERVEPLQYIRAVSVFCYNELSSLNAYEKGKEICGECWAYKFSEVVNNNTSYRACVEGLLWGLPKEQAEQLMQYCYDKYKDHPEVVAAGEK